MRNNPQRLADEVPWEGDELAAKCRQAVREFEAANPELAARLLPKARDQFARMDRLEFYRGMVQGLMVGLSAVSRIFLRDPGLPDHLIAPAARPAAVGLFKDRDAGEDAHAQACALEGLAMAAMALYADMYDELKRTPP